MHSFSHEERRAFSEHINELLKDDHDLKGVLPLNPNSDELFDVASQGLLLWCVFRVLNPRWNELSSASALASVSHLILAVLCSRACSKFINATKPNVIDERKVCTKPKPSTYEILGNHDLAIQGARDLGCMVINISGQDLMDKKQYLILGLVWQVVKIGLMSKVRRFLLRCFRWLGAFAAKLIDHFLGFCSFIVFLFS